MADALDRAPPWRRAELLCALGELAWRRAGVARYLARASPQAGGGA